MAYGSSLGITLPTVGTTAGPAWATSLNTALTTIISTLEAKVTPSGMDINADLSFRSGATSYMATDVKALEFTNQTSLLAAGTYPCLMFSYGTSTGELYWNDNAGNQVQLTDGGAVNTALSGAITGAGYGSGGVALNWDSGTSTYQLYLNSATPTYGSVLCNDVILNDGDTNTLTLAAPAMGANYTMTLPAAVPATSGTVLQMATSGAVTVSNTGLDDLTLAADQHFTVSGTGRFKHGAMEITIPGVTGFGTTITLSGTGGGVTTSNITNLIYIPINLPTGARITACTAYMNNSGAGTRTVDVRQLVFTTGTASSLASQTTTTTGITSQSVGAISETLVNTEQYVFAFTAANIADILYGIKVTYDFP